MDDKSVQVGLKDLHYALMTGDVEDVAASYAMPVRMAKAIEARITPAVNSLTLYCDDEADEIMDELVEVAVEIQVKDLPLAVQAVILGSNFAAGVLSRSNNDIAPYLALGFKSKKANGKYRFIWLYKGKFRLQEQTYNTKTGTPAFQTPTIRSTFLRRKFDGRWQAIGDEDEAGFVAGDTWFDEVYSVSEVDALDVDVTPADAATEVNRNATVVWEFSNAIRFVDLIPDNFYLLDDTGTPVAGTLSIDAEYKVITFTPATQLAATTLHIAVASNAIHDVYGQAVGENTVTRFTTGS